MAKPFEVHIPHYPGEIVSKDVPTSRNSLFNDPINLAIADLAGRYISPTLNSIGRRKVLEEAKKQIGHTIPVTRLHAYVNNLISSVGEDNQAEQRVFLYKNFLEKAIHIKSDVGELIPSQNLPLERRLTWTAGQKTFDREKEATMQRVNSTDLIRGTLLPRYNQHGIDLLTQIRLIHRAHLRGNEHLVLNSGQAKRLLSKGLSKIDRLGGVIRSEDTLGVNIGLAGFMVLCVGYEHTKAIMEVLAKKAEELFPKHGINPKVNEDSIYYYVSAFQYALALIHPFYEGNGRTSEDFMYALWQRRPDLAPTVRYVASDGSRTGPRVEKRMNLINMGARILMHRMAGHFLDIPASELAPLATYKDLLIYVKSKGKDVDEFEKKYLKYFAGILGTLILKVDSEIFEENKGSWFVRVIDSLADNLKQSSATYALQNGETLPQHLSESLEF